MTPRTHTAGFTLIELLVGLLITGVLLTAIMSFQTSTMGLSSKLDEQSTRLSTLSDISGYVGSRVREAAALPDGLTLNGSTCARAGSAPCLAVILPVVSTGSGTGQITGWQLYAYRYVWRSAVPATDKNPGAWMDAHARALYEERYAPAATSACTGPMVPDTSCFGGTPTVRVLLNDSLSLSSAGGVQFSPFEVQTGNRVILRLRAVSPNRSSGKWTPTLSSDPYLLNVVPRNAGS